MFLCGVHSGGRGGGWGDKKISTKFEDCIDTVICYGAIHAWVLYSLVIFDISAENGWAFTHPMEKLCAKLKHILALWPSYSLSHIRTDGGHMEGNG